MKKFIKNTTKAVVTIAAGVAFVMMFGEAETPGLQFLCTFGSMAVLFGCYKILDKMGTFKEESNVEI